MHQLKTRTNVRGEEPLSELISLRLTEKEKLQLEACARENYISLTEVMRNILRENVGHYCVSENLKKTLIVSNEIDRLLINNRIITSRKESNLSKIREICLDFEAFLDEKISNSSDCELKNRKKDIDELIKILVLNDEFLFDRIKAHLTRIFKNKRLKSLNQ